MHFLPRLEPGLQVSADMLHPPLPPPQLPPHPNFPHGKYFYLLIGTILGFSLEALIFYIFTVFVLLTNYDGNHIYWSEMLAYYDYRFNPIDLIPIPTLDLIKSYIQVSDNS